MKMKKSKFQIQFVLFLLLMSVVSVSAQNILSGTCPGYFDPSGTGAVASSADAFHMLIDTEANGDITFSILGVINNTTTFFRNNGFPDGVVSELTVNGDANTGNKYFTRTINGDKTKITFVKQSTIPENATISISGILEYKTATSGVESDLWPSVNFNFTYGQDCNFTKIKLNTPTISEIDGEKKILFRRITNAGSYIAYVYKNSNLLYSQAVDSGSVLNYTPFILSDYTVKIKAISTNIQFLDSENSIGYNWHYGSVTPGASNYCSYLIGSNYSDYAYLSWQTDANGSVVISLNGYAGDNSTTFRSNGMGDLSRFTVNGNPASDYFTKTYTIGGSSYTLTLKPGVTLAQGVVISYSSGYVEWLTSKNNNAYGIYAFANYVYGSDCSSFPTINSDPANITFSPVAAIKTFKLTGSNLTSNVTITPPKGISVSPTSIAPVNNSINQTITASWVDGSGSSSGSIIQVSGGGLVANVPVIVNTTGFSGYCNKVIYQENTSNWPAYLSISMNSDKTQMFFSISPYNAGETAVWKFISQLIVNGGAANAMVSSNVRSTDKSQITITFNQALQDGDLVTFGNAMAWEITGAQTNTNCFTNQIQSPYTVGQSCNISSINVSTNNNTSNLSCIDCDLIVNEGVLLNIDDSKTFKNVSVNPGAKLTLRSGKTLNANSILLESNSTGTATVIDEGGTLNATTATVQQYLTGGRNWYISSPVEVAATSSLSSATSVVSYNEPTASWVTETGSTLNPLKGYISASTTSDGAVSFSGVLNTGNKSIDLTRTPDVAKSGFNLVGNPYPSYLNWDLVSAASTNLQTTIWFRTKTAGTNSVYTFDTYNATSAVGTNNNLNGAVTKYIPPMQAFWVRVAEGKTSGTLSLNNNMRSHNDVPANRFRAPAGTKSEQRILRLQVSNGKNADETIVLFNENASNNFDDYDSQKISNGNAAMPEICTLSDNQQLVINGLSNITADTELPVGFSTGESNTFSIKAIEMENFDSGVQIILKDKLQKSESDLTTGAAYTFTSEVANTQDRFSLLFKAPSIATDINSAGNQHVSIYKNENNRIVISIDGPIENGSSVMVCNALGQKLLSEQIWSSKTILNTLPYAGVYIVCVQHKNKITTSKIILK